MKVTRKDSVGNQEITDTFYYLAMILRQLVRLALLFKIKSAFSLIGSITLHLHFTSLSEYRQRINSLKKKTTKSKYPFTIECNNETKILNIFVQDTYDVTIDIRKMFIHCMSMVVICHSAVCLLLTPFVIQGPYTSPTPGQCSNGSWRSMTIPHSTTACTPTCTIQICGASLHLISMPSTRK